MAEVKVLTPGFPGSQPQETHPDSDSSLASKPRDLPFNPEALKRRYTEEREKRLKYSLERGGVDQYRLVEQKGPFAHYLHDPWIEPGFKRDPVNEEVDVVIIGGGYGAQLVAVRLIEAGVTNIRIIEKAGGFGGTWYVSFSGTISLF